MKAHIIKILLLCLLFFAQTAYGQICEKEAYFNNPKISLDKFLNIKLAEEHKKFDWPTCITSAIFVKFTVDSLGNIKHLVFSQFSATPQVIRTILQFTILSTNGMWAPREVNGKPVESKPFILPFVYDLEAGCLISNSDGKPVYKELQNALAASVDYMLEFDDNVGTKPQQLDCIVLKPIFIGSAN
jgi:hypothetical protein